MAPLKGFASSKYRHVGHSVSVCWSLGGSGSGNFGYRLKLSNPNFVECRTERSPSTNGAGKRSIWQVPTSYRKHHSKRCQWKTYDWDRWHVTVAGHFATKNKLKYPVPPCVQARKKERCCLSNAMSSFQSSTVIGSCWKLLEDCNCSKKPFPTSSYTYKKCRVRNEIECQPDQGGESLWE